MWQQCRYDSCILDLSTDTSEGVNYAPASLLWEGWNPIEYGPQEFGYPAEEKVLFSVPGIDPNFSVVHGNRPVSYYRELVLKLRV
jgi:hypothetical protein